MRLHLDTSGTNGSAETANAALAATGKSSSAKAAAPRTDSPGSEPNLQDSVAVSSASSAWSASFSDRAARVTQLAATVQNGTYRVPSAAVSQSIVSAATTG